MRRPRTCQPGWSGSSTDRRTVLRATTAALATVASGGLAGCFDAPVDETHTHGSAGDRNRAYPVEERLDLLPGPAHVVGYVHVRDLLADPVYRRFVAAVLRRSLDVSSDDPVETLATAFDDALPVDFDGLRAVAGTTLLDEPGVAVLVWTDWDPTPIFSAIEAEAGSEAVERRTVAGSQMLVQTNETGLLGEPVALGSLGDGRFVAGTHDRVEQVHEIVAGERDSLGGDLRDGMLAAPDGPVQASLQTPEMAGEGVARTETEVVDHTDTRTAGPPATPPPERTRGPSVPLDRLQYAYGGIHGDEDQREVAVTLVAEAGSGATVAAGVDSFLRKSGPRVAGRPLDEVAGDASISQQGDRVTVRYAGSAQALRGLAADLDREIRNRTTVSSPEPEPPRGLRLVTARGLVEDGAVGAAEFVLEHLGDAPAVDLRGLFLRLAGPEFDYPFFHPDREVDVSEAFGRFGVRLLDDGEPVLSGTERAALLIDLGADSPGVAVDPIGDPIPPGTRCEIVFGNGEWVSGVPLAVPEALTGDEVSLAIERA